MKPEAKTKAVKKPPDDKFRPRVFAEDRLHDLRATGWRKHIHIYSTSRTIVFEVTVYRGPDEPRDRDFPLSGQAV